MYILYYYYYYLLYQLCILFCQSIRVKVIQNATTVEKRFSSWIGGSILASLVRIHNKLLHVFIALLYNH